MLRRMNPLKPRRNGWRGIVGGVLLSLMGAAFIGSSAVMLYRQNASRYWPTTSGAITRSDVEQVTGRGRRAKVTHHVRLRYSYVVNRTQLVGRFLHYEDDR